MRSGVREGSEPGPQASRASSRPAEPFDLSGPPLACSQVEWSAFGQRPRGMLSNGPTMSSPGRGPQATFLRGEERAFDFVLTRHGDAHHAAAPAWLCPRLAGFLLRSGGRGACKCPGARAMHLGQWPLLSLRGRKRSMLGTHQRKDPDDHFSCCLRGPDDGRHPGSDVPVLGGGWRTVSRKRNGDFGSDPRRNPAAGTTGTSIRLGFAGHSLGRTCSGYRSSRPGQMSSASAAPCGQRFAGRLASGLPDVGTEISWPRRDHVGRRHRRRFGTWHCLRRFSSTDLASS